jgi:hypothetical protein
LVAGAIANKLHNGGATWTRLSWALGLQRLGFDVFFVEQINPEHCLDATGAEAAFEDSLNLAYFRNVSEQYGLSGSTALIYDHGRQVHGASWNELLDIAASAELLVNITGHLTLDPLSCLPRRKAYVDLDPGFTQYWQATGHSAGHLDGHDLFFTVGENIGTPDCPIPTGGLEWRSVRQPVVLDLWPVAPSADPCRFTTIASWRGPYGSVEVDGHSFGLKVHEFRKFIAMPERTGQRFEIALDIHPADAADLALLGHHHWRIVEPSVVVPDPADFQRYVAASGAEFSVAQGIYVETRSGWFSDRTTRYLASGKPALVQDTGFGAGVPLGEGLLTFRTIEEAAAGVERIARDYAGHCRAARALAEEFFDSDVVLGQFVDELGITP